MKNAIKTTKVFMGAILTLGVILALSGPVHAKWYYNHGTAGHIQNESVLNSSYVYYGWGMDFNMNPFSSTWAHMHVPLPFKSSKGVDKVFVEVQVYDINGKVDKVHVYSGGALLHEFENLNWLKGNHAKTLDMGAVKNVFGAIGISIECKSTDGTARIIVKRVAANVKRK